MALARTIPLRLVGAALPLALGCNLVFGIEERPLKPPEVDAGVEPPPPPPPPPIIERCKTAADCKPPNGCYAAECDAVQGVCLYTLCASKTQACVRGICNAQAGTCGNEAPYAFRASTFQIRDATLGCNGSAEACTAAAFPFLFVGTTSGLHAYQVDDLTSTAPRKVPVEGVPFPASVVLVSERRVYLMGDVQGTAPPYTIPIAVADVPSNPTATAIRAQASTIAYPFPKATYFAAPEGSLFVAFNDAAALFPVMVLKPPLKDRAVAVLAGTTSDAGPPDHVMYTTQNVVAGGSFVGASGGRLVVYRAPNNFQLDTNPGTDKSIAQPAQPAPAFDQVLGAGHFASGADGSFVWSAPHLANNGDCHCRSDSRACWLYPSGIADKVEGTQLAAYEAYVNLCANGTPQACGYTRQPSYPAWIDPRTMLVVAPQDEAATKASVRVLTRDPIALQPQRREIIDHAFATAKMAVVASGKIGFVLRADGLGNAMQVSVFDPRCQTP